MIRRAFPWPHLLIAVILNGLAATPVLAQDTRAVAFQGVVVQVPADWREAARGPEQLRLRLPDAGRATLKTWDHGIALMQAAGRLVTMAPGRGWQDVRDSMTFLHGRRAYWIRSRIPGEAGNGWQQVAYLFTNEQRACLLHVIQPADRFDYRRIAHIAESLHLPER